MITNTKTIFIETDSLETVVVRSSSERIAIAYCEACGLEAEMLDLNSAVTASGRGARDLIREIESGAIHSSQTSNGHLLICGRSLQSPDIKQEGTQL